MKAEIIQSLTNDFESYAKQTENGVEFWLARDLQCLLGYGKWDNFKFVISKAKTACEVAGHTVPDYFVDANKMVSLGSGNQREVPDMMLTPYPATSSPRTATRAKRKSPLPKPTLPFKPGNLKSSKREFLKQSAYQPAGN